MNRTQRRAAMRHSQKTQKPTPEPITPNDTIPEPGFPFPSFSSLTDTPKPDHPPNPISEAQLNANRANSQHSTGPKTDAGRATSSQNHTIHGLARHNGHFALLTSEDPAAFATLKTGLANSHQPTDEAESDLVNAMAESRWLANRAQTLQNSCTDPHTGQITDAKMFDRYLRYETKHTHDFNTAFNNLLKRRAAKHKVENGFEAQQRKNAELRLKTERQEMKNKSQYWEVLRKDGEACHQIAVNALFNTKAAAENPGFEAQYNAELKKRGLHPIQMDVAAA